MAFWPEVLVGWAPVAIAFEAIFAADVAEASGAGVADATAGAVAAVAAGTAGAVEGLAVAVGAVAAACTCWASDGISAEAETAAKEAPVGGSAASGRANVCGIAGGVAGTDPITHAGAAGARAFCALMFRL
jgi:hypothetical protein